MSMYRSAFTILALLLLTSTSAQVQVEWINLYPKDGVLIDGALDKEGNLIILARASINNTPDIFILKIDASGNTMWQEYYDSSFGNEYPLALSLDDANNIYITGYDDDRGLTYKYSKNGSLIWKVYSGYQSHDIFCDSHSNIYVVGNDTGVLARKYDSVGTLVSSFGLDTPNHSVSYHIELNESGDIFIGGTDLIGQKQYFFVEKYDSNEVLQWHTAYVPDDTIPQYPWNMVLDKNSNAYMVASAEKGSEEMYCVLRFGNNGAMDWASFENFGDLFDDMGRDVHVDLNGNSYVTGRSFDGTISSCITIKYDSTGAFLWSHKIPGSIPPGQHQKVRYQNGNVYIMTPHSASFGSEFLLKKLNANGDSIWQVTYPGSPYLLLIDSLDNIYVSGIDSSGESLVTIKYSQPVGINSIQPKNNSLGVSPNPFHSITTIQIPQSAVFGHNLKIEIFDLPGKLMMKENIHHAGNYTLNRSALGNGMYLVKLLSENKVIGTAKIVIQ